MNLRKYIIKMMRKKIIMDYYHCELRRFRHFLQRNFPGILRDATQDKGTENCNTCSSTSFIRIEILQVKC